jgi:transcriptional regulator with XRE-family HTH domain
MTVNERIRAERERRGWTKRDLAERAALDPSIITRIEQGASRPSADSIARISRAFDLEPGVLLGTCEPAADEVYRVNLRVIPPAERDYFIRSVEALLGMYRRRQDGPRVEPDDDCSRLAHRGLAAAHSPA